MTRRSRPQVKEFQDVHGIKADGIAGAGTIEALNRGASYYEQRILINLERAKRLPAPEEQPKYAIVDAGDARLSLWENGRKVDEMKVVVGKSETATPMMAAYIRYASVNPYWNVPPELVRSLIGPRIVTQGISYLTDREYQVLTGYGDDAQILDPHDVDWQAVVAGREEVRLRRLPSPANSMGMMKFMLPNYFGIYLHDSPEKEHFTKNELWISNGCVRVEDYKRFAAWLFDGAVPKGHNPKVEEEVDLPRPVPVYMTYLTAQPKRRRRAVHGRPLRPRRASDAALRRAADGGGPRRISPAALRYRLFLIAFGHVRAASDRLPAIRPVLGRRRRRRAPRLIRACRSQPASGKAARKSTRQASGSRSRRSGSASRASARCTSPCRGRHPGTDRRGARGAARRRGDRHLHCRHPGDGKELGVVARTRSDHKLVRSGPFAVVRHPIYLALLLYLLSFGIAFGHLGQLLIAVPLYCVGAAIRIREEEKLLRAQFGEEHARYVREVPAFIPFLRLG